MKSLRMRDHKLKCLKFKTAKLKQSTGDGAGVVTEAGATVVTEAGVDHTTDYIDHTTLLSHLLFPSFHLYLRLRYTKSESRDLNQWTLFTEILVN